MVKDMMTRKVALAALSVSLLGIAGAAPAPTSANPRLWHGLTNARRVVQSKLRREEKVQGIRKQGQGIKDRAQPSK